MRKEIKYSLLLFICCLFLGVSNVHAITNIGPFSGLTLAENGMYYDNLTVSGANTSLGYQYIETSNSSATSSGDYNYYVAYPTKYTDLANYGETLTQCGLYLVKDHYYSVLYYFTGNSTYIYSPYAQTTFKLGIHTNVGNPVLNFNPTEWYSDLIASGLPNMNFKSVHSFNLIFKAKNNGNCLSTAVTTQTIQNNQNYGFVGYKLTDFGEKPPTTSDIKNELEGSFNQINSNLKDIENHLNGNINASTGSINNNIDSAENHLNNNINASTNVIMNNVDSMKEEQKETNEKLDEINNADISDKDKEAPDDSKFQDYNDAENILKDKVNQADLSNLSVGIDGKSSKFVWDNLTDFIKSHSVVFSLYISILTVGIIKLALGR